MITINTFYRKNTILRYIIIKFLKISDKVKIMIAKEEEDTMHKEEIKIRMIIDFSLERMDAGR